jgi:hypothetical protein
VVLLVIAVLVRPGGIRGRTPLNGPLGQGETELRVAPGRSPSVTFACAEAPLRV